MSTLHNGCVFVRDYVTLSEGMIQSKHQEELKDRNISYQVKDLDQALS